MHVTDTQRGFPLGVLFVMLLLLAALSIAASAGYFYYTCTGAIRDTVDATRKHSTELIEALGSVAELSYAGKSYGSLRLLLREKIKGNNGMVAFFTLADGSIKAHSSPEDEKAVAGNIAGDEFAYNRDQIFLPLAGKANEVHFLEYNIIARSVPFDRRQREFIKRFFYPAIGSTGWLATRAVYHRGKPVGTINFIISKDRVYSVITNTAAGARKLLTLLLLGSLLASLIVSLMVFLRAQRVPAMAFAGADSGPREGAFRGGRVPARPAASGVAPGDATAHATGGAIRDAIPIIK
ncbi:MAG TPA: hypothetical protein VLM75_14045 [Spirochaetota bacterium]|nr:hypothetical protein [Spirochaetota bacterium]